MSALDKQVGGGHYKQFKIQPIEFITKNGLGFIEGNIIKYICRHPFKDQVKDVDKVIHYCELLKQLTYEIAPEAMNELEKVVSDVQTTEETTAVNIARLVTESPIRTLILKKIVHDMIVNGAAGELEDTINEAVSNNRDVHELTTTYLDISIKGQQLVEVDYE